MKPLIRKRKDCGWTVYFRTSGGTVRRESHDSHESTISWLSFILTHYREFLKLPVDYPARKENL